MNKFLVSLTTVGALSAVVACSDSDESTPDTGGQDVGQDASGDIGADTGADTVDDTSPDAIVDVGSDVGPADDRAPTLRDIRYDFVGDLGGGGDLNALDKRAAIPTALELTFTVFAIDNSTATEDLTVRVLDVAGEEETELTPTATELASGLWDLTYLVEAGVVLQVEVADEAGNAVRSEGALTIPSVGEVLVGDWVGRTFESDQSVLTARDWTFADDGTWTAASPDAEGAYEVDGFSVSLRETVGDDAADEWRHAVAYVDDLYVDFDPFTFTGDAAPTTDLVGTWVSTATILDTDGTEIAQVSDTVVFGDDGNWSRAWERTGDSPASRTAGGAFRIELNENYSENFGDFIVWETTEEDGEDVEMETTMIQWRLRGETLLLAPLLPAE